MKFNLRYYCGIYLFVSMFWLGISFSQAQGENPRKTKAYLKFQEAQDSLGRVLATGDSMGIAEWHYILGKRYMGLNNYIKARQHLFHSISIWGRRGPSEKIARAYARLFECEVFEKDNGNIDNAILYAEKIMRNSQEAKTHLGLMNAYCAKAGLHYYALQTGKRAVGTSFLPSLDSAIYYQSKALKIAVALRKTLDIALGYDLLGDRWSGQGYYEKGISFEKQAIQLYRKIGRVESTIEPILQIGTRYIDLGNLGVAKQWIDRSKYLADSCNWGPHSYLSYLAQNYARYYAGRGELRKAMAYQKEEYEQKLVAEQSYRKTAMEAIVLSQENEQKEYQLKTQSQKIASQQQQAKMQSWLFIMSFLLIVLTTIVAILSHRLYRKYQIESRKNENLYLEQSHRIKNNLASISSILQLQLGSVTEPGTVQVITESVGRVEAMSFIHRRLYGKVQSVEIEVREYIEDLIENVLTSYNLAGVVVNNRMEHLMLHVDKAISLGLIVNELATNACKYALTYSPNPELTITCYQKGADVFFALEDNGPGFEPELHRKSFGLELIQIWVDNLGGNSSFAFVSGTCFSLSFARHVTFDLAHQSEYNG